MDIENVHNNIICFELEFGAMMTSLILAIVSSALTIWGVVNGGPVTIIFFREYAYK